MNKKGFILILTTLAMGILSFTFASSFTKDLMVNNRTSLSEEMDLSEDIIENKVSKASILSVGDIMFHMPQVNSAYDLNTKAYDFRDVFKYIKPYTQSVDLAVANFETVIAGNHMGFSGFPNFNSPVETLDAIKDAGFHILTTANNHCLDQGKKGLMNTIDAIESYGMKNIGTCKEPNPPIMIEEINEIKLGLLSYTYGFNGMEYTLTKEEKEYMVNQIDEERIKLDIEKTKELGADMLIVFIHWGVEYQRVPSKEQLELGRKMIEWGADIIFGSHPHVVQKSEIINYDGKDKFIIYSMGNFLSNQREEIMGSRFTEDGIMIKIHIEKDNLKDETIIKEIQYIPTWVNRFRKDGRWKYEILPIEDFIKDESLQLDLRDKAINRIKESFKDTMELMTQY